MLHERWTNGDQSTAGDYHQNAQHSRYDIDSCRHLRFITSRNVARPCADMYAAVQLVTHTRPLLCA